MLRLLFVAVALSSFQVAAQEPASIESIAAGYFGAASYCDAGKMGLRDDPKQPFAREVLFERCARGDGRFKHVERDAHAGASVKWSGGARFYRYLEYGRRYQEFTLGESSIFFDYFRERSQIYPVFVFEAFSTDPRDHGGAAERARYLKSYVPSATLSTPVHSVFDRSDTQGNVVERLWVLNADKSIARYERMRNGGVVRFVEITSRELNRPLSDVDLWYDAPLLARFSLSNNPIVFVAGLHVVAALVGALFWGWRFARATEIYDVLESRGRLWRLQLWIFGGIALLLGALAAAVYPGGGHPPAIAYVWVMGLWCAVAFGLTACFTLASYPMGLLYRATRGSTSRSGGG